MVAAAAEEEVYTTYEELPVTIHCLQRCLCTMKHILAHFEYEEVASHHVTSTSTPHITTTTIAPSVKQLKRL